MSESSRTRRRSSHKKKSRIKWWWVVLAIVGLVGGGFGYYFYNILYKANTNTLGKNNFILYIPENAIYKQVIDSLDKYQIIKDKTTFKYVSELKKYPTLVKPGRYIISDGMSNSDIINKLRLGNQDAVKLTIYGVRKKADLAGKVSHKIDIDSAELLKLLNDDAYLDKFTFNSDNVLAMIVPNSYSIFWNTSADKFMHRMNSEYKFFWNGNRRVKAEAVGLSPVEVSVLASIVQSETNVALDKPIIAGVYLNRLKKGMPLEADPTLVWALNDFTIKRVLNVHKEIESPYNTYKYKGLPPGPITLATPESIDAVLNFTQHQYLYFCAREDFSGYSSFAETYEQHLKNARRYQRALSQKGILK